MRFIDVLAIALGQIRANKLRSFFTLLGIIVSAALGGIILALAGLLMMIPFILLATTVLALMARAHARKPRTIRARTYWH